MTVLVFLYMEKHLIELHTTNSHHDMIELTDLVLHVHVWTDSNIFSVGVQEFEFDSVENCSVVLQHASAHRSSSESTQY